MRLTPRARAILGIALAPILLGGLLVPASASARPGTPVLSTVASDPVGAILGQYPPNESPSGAGERYLLERAGLVPAPPVKDSTTPKRPAVEQFGPNAAGDPIFGADVMVNDPADDNLNTDNTTQSETALAVNGNVVCAGYNDFTAGGLSGLASSANSGQTFTDLDGIGGRGDPVIATHLTSGDFYYGEIATHRRQPRHRRRALDRRLPDVRSRHQRGTRLLSGRRHDTERQAMGRRRQHRRAQRR